MSTSSDVTPASSQSPAETCTGQGVVQELVPVRFGRSRRLWQFELAVYLALLCFTCAAIIPVLLVAWYWPIVLGVCILVIGRYLSRSWRNRHSSVRCLYCTQSRWYLSDQSGVQEISFYDEILFWPHIIVLPVRSALGVKSYLVLTPDAMEADDWRRLRVWLRYSCR